MPKTMGKYKRLEVFHLSKPVYTADKPSDCHKRATKESFEKWYQNQTRYQLAEDRQERS